MIFHIISNPDQSRELISVISERFCICNACWKNHLKKCELESDVAGYDYKHNEMILCKTFEMIFLVDHRSFDYIIFIRLISTYIECPSWPQYLTAWPTVFIINEIFSFVEKFSVETSSSLGSTLINAKVMIPRAPIPTKIENKVILKVEVTSLWPCQAKYTFMDHFCDHLYWIL